MGDRCDSCGDGGPGLATVQRVYVTFDEHHQPVGHRLADEFETWCPVCQATYPHQEVVDGSAACGRRRGGRGG